MDESEIMMIPFHSHEMDMDRAERANHRLWVIIIVLIVALIGTNAGWLYYESQFTDEVVTIEQEGQTDDGGNNIFNGTGEMTIYGESEADNQGQAQSP